MCLFRGIRVVTCVVVYCGYLCFRYGTCGARDVTRTIRGVDCYNRNGSLRLPLTRIVSTASSRDSSKIHYTYTLSFLAYIFISLNFLAIHILYISIHIFPVISKFYQRFWTSRCAVLSRTIAICVKLLITRKLFSVGNSIKAFDFSCWCEYFNVPMCQTIGLCHTFTRCSRAALARKL